MRRVVRFGMVVLVLAAASAASAVTLGGSDAVDVNSFVFDKPAGTLDEYVAEGSAVAPAAEAAEPSATSEDLLYYMSEVPTAMASTLLDGSRTNEGAAAMTNPTPEPSAAFLLLSGLGVAARVRKRRRG